MANPKKLINTRTGGIWDWTPDLATNTDLQPYYEGEVEDAPVEEPVEDDDDLVDPDTGEIIVKPAIKIALKKGPKK